MAPVRRIRRSSAIDEGRCARPRHGAGAAQTARRSGRRSRTPSSASSSSRRSAGPVTVLQRLDERPPRGIGHGSAACRRRRPARSARRASADLAPAPSRAGRPRAAATSRRAARRRRRAAARSGTARSGRATAPSGRAPRRARCRRRRGASRTSSSPASAPRNESSRVALAGRLRRRDREDGPDPERAAVERLEEHRAGRERRRRREPDRADRVGDLRRRVGRILGCPRARREARARSSDRSRGRSPSAPASRPRASGGRARRRPPRAPAARARARAASSPRCRRAERRPRRFAARRRASARARRRRDRTHSSSQSKPPHASAVETSSPSSTVRKSASSSDGRGPAWARAKIAAAGSRWSSSSAISASSRAAEPRRALLDERAHERPVLVERRAAGVLVLDERDRQLGAVVELAEEVREGAEHEAAEGRVEMRSARSHAYGLRAPGRISCQARPAAGPRWQPGHQYAVRLSSPCHAPRITLRSARHGDRRAGRRACRGRGPATARRIASAPRPAPREARRRSRLDREPGRQSRPPRAPRTSTCSRSLRRAADPGAPHRAARLPSRAAEARHESRRVGRLGEQIRAEPPHRTRGRGVSTGPFHCVASISPARSTSHGAPGACRADRPDVPAAVHPQMAAKRRRRPRSGAAGASRPPRRPRAGGRRPPRRRP